MASKKPEEVANELIYLLKKKREEIIRQGAEFAISKIRWEFKTEKEATGKEWEPVDEKYLRRKIKKGFSEKTLHRTTTLKQSFFARYEKNKGIVGTPVEYAIFHEKGTRYMPARPFVKPVEEIFEKEIGNIALKVLIED